MDSTQNLWEVYGFRESPFNTDALSIVPEITFSIKNAYIKRSGEAIQQEKRFDNFFRSGTGGRIVVEGESGIGKTTFVNAFRYRWGYLTDDKLLTPFSAIQVRENWGPHDFLLSSVFHLTSRLRFEFGEHKFMKDNTLKEIASAIGVLREEKFGGGLGLQTPVGGINVQVKSTASTTVGNVGPDILYSYMKLLLQISKRNGYKGLILHYDNMEMVKPDLLIKLMNSVRDYLQTPDIYFIFVGGIGTMRDVILPSERVKSIFITNPINVNPLTLEAVHEIIERRCEVCALVNNWVLPVENKLIDTLYTIFNGKIRPIMNEITNLILDNQGGPSQITLDESLAHLKQIKLELLSNTNINDSIKKVFLEATKLKKFHASQLAKQVGTKRQYISDKCIGPMLENKLIIPAEKVGRSQYFEVQPDYLILGVD